MNRLALLVLLALAGTAMAQQPATPAPPPAEATPPKPKPPLKLNLDEVDPPRARITFEPRDGKSQDPVKTLPGLGDAPATGSWERPSSAVYPPDTNPNAR
jgi:hypothetical protein